MEPERLCPQCGRKIPWGQVTCPFCPGNGGHFWSLRRDTFLAIVIACLIVLFIFTGFIVRRYHRVERRLGEDWFSRGEPALRTGDARTALVDFRNALAYSRDNAFYQLRLAQALAATGRVEEARTYLMSLRERDSGNGAVNLELARLAAGEHDLPEAVQYYHDAVYSEWSGDPVVERRRVRLELARFLLDSDQKDAARAELISVAANLPPDPGLQIQVGTLLTKAGGYDDALRLLRDALATEPYSPAALVGAGECYFYTGEYAKAESYLDRALLQDPRLTQAAAMRDTARNVLDLDPFIRRLGEQERAKRERRAFDLAMTRLEGCAAQRGIDLSAAPSSPLQTLYARAIAIQPSIQQHIFNRDTEWVSNTMDLLFEIEKAAARECGEPHGPDLALLLIGQAQEGTRP